MKEFLDHFAAILGAATLGLLAISVSHEYGYFWVIGRQFQTFLTVSDYFSNAVLWLPWTVLILYLYFDWNVVFGLKRYEWRNKWMRWIFVLSLPLSVIVWFFFGTGEFSLFSLLPAAYLWLLVIEKISPFKDRGDNVRRLLHRAVVAGPLIVAAMLVWGIADGRRDLADRGESYTIMMSGGKGAERAILRNFDKGILVKNVAENRIEFIKWDEIADIGRAVEPARKVPIACEWLKINCPK